MALMEAGSGFNPAVKFDDIGDGVIGAVISIDTLPVKDFTTGKIELHETGPKTGQPREQERIAIVALEGVGKATVGKDRAAIQQGDILDIWSSGMKRMAFFEGLNDAGVLNEGDIISMIHHEEEAKGKGFNPLKLYKVEIRPPKTDDPREMAVSAHAKEEHAALQHKTALATGNTEALKDLEPDF